MEFWVKCVITAALPSFSWKEAVTHNMKTIHDKDTTLMFVRIYRRGVKSWTDNSNLWYIDSLLWHRRRWRADKWSKTPYLVWFGRLQASRIEYNNLPTCKKQKQKNICTCWTPNTPQFALEQTLNSWFVEWSLVWRYIRQVDVCGWTKDENSKEKTRQIPTDFPQIQTNTNGTSQLSHNSIQNQQHLPVNTDRVVLTDLFWELCDGWRWKHGPLTSRCWRNCAPCWTASNLQFLSWSFVLWWTQKTTEALFFFHLTSFNRWTDEKRPSDVENNTSLEIKKIPKMISIQKKLLIKKILIT